MRRSNPSFLNGVPEMLVLKLLSTREMYGYEIVKALQTESGEQFAFGEGCVYPILHYLEAEKLVTSRQQEVEGRSRYYYRTTARGQKRLAALAGEWQQVATGIGMIMGGQNA